MRATSQVVCARQRLLGAPAVRVAAYAYRQAACWAEHGRKATIAGCARRACRQHTQFVIKWLSHGLTGCRPPVGLAWGSSQGFTPREQKAPAASSGGRYQHPGSARAVLGSIFLLASIGARAALALSQAAVIG